MMGVGSSFKEGDKHENLNMLLSELSPSVLLILDTVAVRCWRGVVEVDGRVTPIVTGYRCVRDGGGAGRPEEPYVAILSVVDLVEDGSNCLAIERSFFQPTASSHVSLLVLLVFLCARCPYSQAPLTPGQAIRAPKRRGLEGGSSVARCTSRPVTLLEVTQLLWYVDEGSWGWIWPVAVLCCVLLWCSGFG